MFSNYSATFTIKAKYLKTITILTLMLSPNNISNLCFYSSLSIVNKTENVSRLNHLLGQIWVARMCLNTSSRWPIIRKGSSISSVPSEKHKTYQDSTLLKITVTELGGGSAGKSTRCVSIRTCVRIPSTYIQASLGYACSIQHQRETEESLRLAEHQAKVQWDSLPHYI